MIVIVNVQTGDVTQGELLPDEITVIPDSQKLAAELAVLAAQYKADAQSLQLSWLSAAVTNGAQEATKKAAYVSELAALKTQYVADIAATKARYI